MKAFVSYSFQDTELFIITLLFEQLRNKGFIVESSDFSNLGRYDNFKISTSDYFIGIITNHSDSINSVIRDWQVANTHKIKTILLIEEGVNIQNPTSLHYIRFNRNNPQPAINSLLKLNSPNQLVNSQEGNLENAFAIGIIVVGLAALISMLAGGRK